MSIVRKVERIRELSDEVVDYLESNEKKIEELEEERDRYKSKAEDLESELEEFQGDGVNIVVNIQSENHIVAEWAAEEVVRIIKTHGTVKAYEIFKSI